MSLIILLYTQRKNYTNFTQHRLLSQLKSIADCMRAVSGKRRFNRKHNAAEIGKARACEI